MKWKRRCELRQSQRTARLSIRKRMGLFHLSGTDRRLSGLICKYMGDDYDRRPMECQRWRTWSKRVVSFGGSAKRKTSSLKNSVHGLLTINEKGQITLQLEGPLWFKDPKVSWDWHASRWLPATKRIIGRLGEYGDDGYVLLHELLRTDFSLADGPARQSYEAGFCFKHDHGFPSNFDHDSFHTLRIELEGLEEWLRLQAIDLGEEVWHGDQVEFIIKYERIEIDYVTSRAKVSIRNLVLGNTPLRLFPGPVATVNIRQTNWLVYEPKEQLPFNELQVCFRRVEEVIALLLGQYFHLHWPQLVANFGEFDEWFTLYWKRGRRQTAPSVYFMMTMFPSVREDFGKDA